MGARSEDEMEEMLRPTEFLLYHRAVDKNEEVPVSLPLMVAYRTSMDGFKHYYIETIRDTCPHILYRVKYGGNHMPTFASLQVRYTFRNQIIKRKKTLLSILFEISVLSGQVYNENHFLHTRRSRRFYREI